MINTERVNSVESSNIEIGSLIEIEAKKYRVVFMSDGKIVLIDIASSKVEYYYRTANEIRQLIRNDKAKVLNETPIVVDLDKMSEKEREKFQQNKIIIQRIIDVYGPSFIGLEGKAPKPLITELMNEYSLSKSTIWRLIRRYIQSGFAEYSLADRKAYSQSHLKKDMKYTAKAGRKTEDGIAIGVILTDNVRSQFQEFLDAYKNGREQTYKKAYCGLLDKYYSETKADGSFSWVPESQRPTYDQFYYYCRTKMSKEEKDIIKTSKMEQRNAKRLLLGSSRQNAIRPGWIVEADALEVDVSIVSSSNKEQTVGRPIVYVMIDVFTSAIVAFSVSFENNSMIGLTNMFINLGEDKHKFTERYEIMFDEDCIWPSNFIPHEIRCDRGSDFKSDKFSKVCQRLGINRTLESGGTGSMKGIVEQSFHQFQMTMRSDLEGNGLITKRYDTNHHREAMLTLKDFTKMFISFLLYHNQRYIKDYPMSKEMLEDKVKPVPMLLWEYGCEKYGAPAPISVANRQQYFFDLMIEKKATLSRQGIKLGELKYICDNEWLLTEMYALGNRKKEFVVRCDPRDISTVYFLQGGTLIAAELNDNIPGMSSFEGLTMLEYEQYEKERKRLKKEGDKHNLEVDAALYRNYANIVDSAKTEVLADATNLRNNRIKEKAAVNYEMRIAEKIDSVEEGQKSIEKKDTKNLFEPNDDFMSAYIAMQNNGGK